MGESLFYNILFINSCFLCFIFFPFPDMTFHHLLYRWQRHQIKHGSALVPVAALHSPLLLIMSVALCCVWKNPLQAPKGQRAQRLEFLQLALLWLLHSCSLLLSMVSPECAAQ